VTLPNTALISRSNFVTVAAAATAAHNRPYERDLTE
jgi:hypothetical protein